MAFLVFLSLFAARAFADSGLFIIEPYVGGGASVGGHQDLDFKNGTSAILDPKYSTGMAGLRLSYFQNGLWLGLDGNYYPSAAVTAKTRPGYSWTWNSVTMNEENYRVSRAHLGVDLGFRHIFLIWGSYFPLAQLKVRHSSEHEVFQTDDSLRGSGWGGGIGYTFLPHLILAVEFRSFKYTDNGTAASTLPAGMTYDFNVDEVMAELTFPFEF